MEEKFHREKKTIELIETLVEWENFLLWSFSSIYLFLCLRHGVGEDIEFSGNFEITCNISIIWQNPEEKNPNNEIS
jgi:hypothetical protein